MLENQTNIYAGIEAKVDDKIADHVASIALEQITPEQFEKMVGHVLNNFKWPDKKGWCRYELTPFEEKVIDKFYHNVGNKIDQVLSTDNYEEQADEVAMRIIVNARQASEEYLTKAIAQRMCNISTDFYGRESEIKVSSIVMDVMNKHMRDLHNGIQY